MTEQFNAAEVRLDLVLVGHSIADTLLFGARVLSIPGVLSHKNIKDVENNFVGGKHNIDASKVVCENVNSRLSKPS